VIFRGIVITLLPAYTFASVNGAISVGQAGHPIFNNGIYPSGNNWNGNYFSHDIVNGPSLNALITCNQAMGNQIGLTELTYGCGKVMFGGMVTPNFHQPQPNGDNLRRAILDYLHPCTGGYNYSCPIYIIPLNNSIQAKCHGPILLAWNQSGGGCGSDSLHYLLSFGTNNPPTNIYNQLDIGNTLSYTLTNPPINFIPGQKYY